MQAWIAVLVAVAVASQFPVRADETVGAETEPTQATAETAAPAVPAFPLALHCGQLVSIAPATTTEGVDLQKVLAKGEFEPGDAPSDTSFRTPAAGTVFAIAEIRLNAKGSVGRTDFVLRCGDQESKCMALGRDANAFDERLWEVKKGTARLLFEVPQDTHAVTLAYAPQLSIALPPAPELPFGEQPEPAVAAQPEPAPTATSAPKPEPEAAPAPTPAAKPAAASAPKPTPKPPAAKPKPKPEPKKPEPSAGIPLF